MPSQAQHAGLAASCVILEDQLLLRMNITLIELRLLPTSTDWAEYICKSYPIFLCYMLPVFFSVIV
jgi:hypothetical protein